MNRIIMILVSLMFLLLTAGVTMPYSADLQPITTQDEPSLNNNEEGYIECLVKTSDNILSKEPKEKWTQEMLDEERRANSKQGYIIICKEPQQWYKTNYYQELRNRTVCVDGNDSIGICYEWGIEYYNETLSEVIEDAFEVRWGTQEKDPKRFAIVRFNKTEFNSSWLEPEYDLDNPVCYDESWNEIPCTKETKEEFKEYPIITEKKYKLPLDTFMSNEEITNLTNIEYNQGVDWTIEKEISDVESKIELNDYENRPDDLVLHGSSGTFWISDDNADCPGGTCNYTSLIAWEAGEEADIRTTGPCVAECYGEGFSHPPLAIDGWTNDDDSHIVITVAEGHRHNGTVGSGFTLTFNQTSNYMILLQEAYHNISYLEINCNSTSEFSNNGGIYASGTIVQNIYNNLIYDFDTRSAIIASYSAGVVNIWNNMIINSTETDSGTPGIKSDDADTLFYVYNNFISSTAYGIDAEDNMVIAKNNICQNLAGNDCFFDSNYNYSSTNNIASDASAPGYNPINDTVLEFINRVYGTGGDFHLSVNDIDAIDNGIDLSADENLAFNYDIDGEERVGAWDIGPDEIIFPRLNFTLPTPANGTTSSDTSYIMNVTIYEDNLTEFIWNWDEVNYTMFDKDTVLHFNFDNVSEFGEGSNINNFSYDASSYHTHGRIVGSKHLGGNYTAGKFGKALGFDTDVNNEYIEVPAADGMGFKEGTVSVWYNRQNSYVSTTYVSILTFREPYQDDNIGLAFYDYGGVYNVHFYLGGDYATDTGFNAPQEDKWHHLSLTWENGNCTLYFDGENVSSDTYDTNGWDTVYGGTIGALKSSSISAHFEGMIDEVRMLNKSISKEEAFYLYATNLNKYDSDKWEFYINQSKNASDGLDEDTYTYYAYAKEGKLSLENTTETRVLTIGTGEDTTPPYWSSNQTNSTANGTAIMHSLYWQDDTGLDGYIFSYCNGSYIKDNNTCPSGYSLGSGGFDVSGIGLSLPLGLAIDPNDYTFWITDYIDSYVYHIDTDGNIISGGFDTSPTIADDIWGITTNGSDFWVVETVDDYVVHFNSSGGFIDQFSTLDNFGLNTPRAIEFDFRDNSFWMSSDNFDYIFHVNISGENLTGGIRPQTGIMDDFDGTALDKSDYTFYQVDANDTTVFHLNSDGNENLYTFNTGISNMRGMAYDDRDGSLWIIGYTDTYLYHFIRSDGWQNDSFVSMIGTGNWSNVTKITKTAVGLNYSWCVYVNDSSGNWNTSSCDSPFYYVTSSPADTTPPTLEWGNPAEINVTLDRNWTYINISGNEALSNCSVNFNGTVTYLDYTVNTLWYHNFTTLGNGNFSFNATCNDTGGNWANLSLVWVNISELPLTPTYNLTNCTFPNNYALTKIYNVTWGCNYTSGNHYAGHIQFIDTVAQSTMIMNVSGTAVINATTRSGWNGTIWNGNEINIGVS